METSMARPKQTPAKQSVERERYPALALLDIDGVAVGIHTTDLMVKKAPIALLKSGTVHPGRYLVLIGGSVASVQASWRTGVDAAGTALIDEVLLPDVHTQVYDAALGRRQPIEKEALGVLECRSVASLLHAADAGVKGAQVSIAEIRLADDLGGRAFVLFNGEVADVEAALEIGTSRIGSERLQAHTIMPRLDGTLQESLTAGTRFGTCGELQPGGAEPGLPAVGTGQPLPGEAPD
jgi:microcompartment protein CcmL/EutN